MLAEEFWSTAFIDPLVNIENAVEGPVSKPGRRLRRGIGRLPDFFRFDMSKKERRRYWKRVREHEKRDALDAMTQATDALDEAVFTGRPASASQRER
jgi:hypothetical protein